MNTNINGPPGPNSHNTSLTQKIFQKRNNQTFISALDQSDAMTVRQDVVDIKINRDLIHKYSSSEYFYLAAYSYETLINNNCVRELLKNINTSQIQKQKQNLGFLNLNPTKKKEKYFGFPEEIVFAQLKNYHLKLFNDQGVSLVEEKDSICFVKMYLFENDIIEPLENELKKLNNFKLKSINTKCQGIRVLTLDPIINKQRQVQPTDTIMETIYLLYKEYINNFGPNLNSSQVLLYLYKQIFNIQNQNFTPEYSQHLTKLLASDLVLKFIQEQLNAQDDLHFELQEAYSSKKHFLDKTITEQSCNKTSIVFAEDSDKSPINKKKRIQIYEQTHKLKLNTQNSFSSNTNIGSLIKESTQVEMPETNVLKTNNSYISNANKINNMVSNFDRLQGLIGGEILSQFAYETSLNQSKLLISNSHLGSQLSSQISSIHTKQSFGKSLYSVHSSSKQSFVISPILKQSKVLKGVKRKSNKENENKHGLSFGLQTSQKSRQNNQQTFLFDN